VLVVLPDFFVLYQLPSYSTISNFVAITFSAKKDGTFGISNLSIKKNWAHEIPE